MTDSYPKYWIRHSGFVKKRIMTIFFVVSEDEAEGQLAKAETVLRMLLPYLEDKWK